MSRENVDIVRRIYDAFGRRDVVTPFQFYAEDIVWDLTHTRRGALFSTPVYHGHNGVRETWREAYASFGAVDFEVEELTDAGRHVFALIREREVGRMSGAPAEATHFAVWTVVGGKVTRLQVFDEREQALEAAGLTDAARCFGDGDPLYERYHDEEWGFPVLDERGLFEKLSLEAFQSGLSWRTILSKRDAFRSAFAEFDPDAVARFGDADVERLLADASIVRNRAKIEATLANARATVALRATGEPLDALIRAHAPAAQDPPPATWADVDSTTPETVALARELKRRDFRFVGPTTLYALMQACGLVDDHLAGCPARPAVERARRASGLI